MIETREVPGVRQRSESLSTFISLYMHVLVTMAPRCGCRLYSGYCVNYAVSDRKNTPCASQTKLLLVPLLPPPDERRYLRSIGCLSSSPTPLPLLPSTSSSSVDSLLGLLLGGLNAASTVPLPFSLRTSSCPSISMAILSPVPFAGVPVAGRSGTDSL